MAKKTSLYSLIDKIYGPKGTPKRDIFEKEYAERLKELKNKSKK